MNALVFLLLLGLGLQHKTSGMPDLACTPLLTIYAKWAGYDYAFGQNWALTFGHLDF